MPTDILLDDSGNLLHKDGDFVIGDSSAQHAKAILESHPGAFRQWPLIGVGVSDYLNDENGATEIRHKMEVHAAYDGATLDSLETVATLDGLTINDLVIRYTDGS